MAGSDIVQATIAEWQNRLLQLDRRNNLLYFKQGARSSVRILTDDVDDFVVTLSESKAGLDFDYGEPRSKKRVDPFAVDEELEPDADEPGPLIIEGDIRADCPPLDLQKRLRALRRKDREWQEEQGVNVLFLAVGFLAWVDEDSMVARAPLLLVPCDLSQVSPRDPFVLIREPDDIAVNVTLAHKLSMLGVALPEFEGDRAPSDYLNEVRRLIRSKPEWSVTDDLTLSTFQFSKIAMWQDLEQLRRDGVEREMVRSLAGDTSVETPELPTGIFNQPIEHLVGGRLDDALDARDQHLVLRADYSQLLAVGAARSGEHLVIHGPPGTGKSQTIANIIGSFIADGKTVLFVSEKTAALDVVKRRLEECQLGVFCLDLHSERGRRSNVYEQLRQSLEERRSVSREEFDFGSLIDARTQLNTYVRSLHERRSPLGRSVYQMHGALAQLRAAPDVPFPVAGALDLDDAKMRNVLRLAGRLAQRADEFAEHFTSLWRGLRETSSNVRLSDELREASRIADDGLRSSTTCAESTQRRVGGPISRSTTELLGRAPLLRLLSEAPGVPKGWLKRSVVERLTQVATDQQAIQRERTELQEQLSEYFGAQRPPINFPELTVALDAALDGDEKIRVLLGDLWSMRLAVECDAITSAAAKVPTATDTLIQAANTLAGAIEASPPRVRIALKARTSQAEEIHRLAPVPPCWVDPRSVAALNDLWTEATGAPDAALDAQDPRAAVALILLKARTARDLVHVLSAAEKPLLAEYSAELVPAVSHEMLVRFRTDHRSFFNRMGGQYRRDQRLLKGTRKSPKKLSIDDATSIVEAALNVQTLRAKWATLSNLLPSWLGRRFLGLETDWSAVEADLSGLDTLLRDLNLNSGLARCLSDSDTAKALHSSTEQVISTLTILEILERTLLGDDRLPADTDRIDSVRLLSDEAFTSLDQLAAVFGRLRPHLVRPLQSVEDMAKPLAMGTRLAGIERSGAERADELKAEFGDRYDGFNTDWSDVLSALEWTSTCLDVAATPIAAELEQHSEHPAPAQQYREWEREIERAAAKFEEAMSAIDAKFLVAKTDWLTWADAQWEDLSAWLLRVSSESERAADWLNYRSLSADFEQIAGSGVLDAIRKVTDTASLIPAVTERRYVTAWLEATYESEPALSRFASKDQSEVIKDFRRLDDRRPVAAQREIRGRAFSRYPEKFVTQAAAGQLGTLRDQLSRKRGQLPVRKLVTRIPTLLQALKPCFMMSPLAVSQFLPKGAEASETLHFDAVIFDEASQVFPEDAVPAIDRAAQVIVVGDERQLPPTSFFRRDMDGADDASDDDDTDDADALKGRDSILEVMNGMLGKGVAERYLEVHYRSRHENLIRFSNHYFYRNRLLVFPSPVTDHADLGLRPVYLPDGRYDAGQGRTRTNRREAEEVVRLVLEHMRTRPLDESIGVVTLSRAQADLIESLIAETRVLERDLDERFREDRREPFFIKNLENVQGDERDHIILSIGYGPTVGSGAVPNRFGPINAEGGERRLNVAVSRARRSMTTVYSLRSTDIVSEQPGARLLRRYIEFIENPTGAFEAEQTIDPSAEAESPFEDAVIDALRARGHRVQPQVGVAGFRIDLGILSPDGKRFDLGIECDGWTYHSSPAARDRDWLRQSILEGLGWRIHRVWSTAWIRNPEEQIREIEEALELARVPSVAGGSALITRPLEPNARVAAPAPPQTLPAQAKPSWIFEPYQRASLRGLRRGEELQYATSAELEPMLLRIAEVEGPVHIDVAIERIREHYGMARARQASRDRVRRAVEKLGKKGSLVLEHERGAAPAGFPQPPPELFVSLPGCEPEPRRPDEGTPGRRMIGQISRGEIERAVLLVARALYGATSNDLVHETARQFWYDRTGPDISARINLCIKAMIKSGQLKGSFGMLAAREQD